MNVNCLWLLFNERFGCSTYMFRTFFRIISVFFIGIGLFLLGANFTGLILGNNVWYKPPAIELSENHAPYNGTQGIPAIKRDEEPLSYAIKMTAWVNQYSSHWGMDKITFSNIPVMAAPFAYSWVIWSIGAFHALVNSNYKLEFCNAEKALERGWGYCSQRSLILQDILRKNGLRARTVKINNHVILLFWPDQEREYILDPDFNIVIPLPLQYVAEHPEITYPLYDKFNNKDTRNYYFPGKWQERGDKEYGCISQARLLYYSIIQWFVPVLLILTGLFIIRKKYFYRKD